MGRRGFLGLVGGGVTSLAGCLESPSSSPPPYETREIADGPCYQPGLRDEQSLDFFAGLVTTDSEARAFDLRVLPRKTDRAFIEATDYRTSYLGVVQVSGLHPSTSIWLVDMAAPPERLGLVLAVEDETTRSDERVITTYLGRVQKKGQAPCLLREPPPDRIWVQLSIGDRTETFSGR
jgi:hypothetical protein